MIFFYDRTCSGHNWDINMIKKLLHVCLMGCYISCIMNRHYVFLSQVLLNSWLIPNAEYLPSQKMIISICVGICSPALGETGNCMKMTICNLLSLLHFEQIIQMFLGNKTCLGVIV